MNLISLDFAHQIMGTFGITSPTAVYERRVRPKGLTAEDLAEILEDSRFVFVTDDSIELYEDLVEPAVTAIQQMGVPIEIGA